MNRYGEYTGEEYVYSDIHPLFAETLVGYDTEYDIDAIKNSLINLFTIPMGSVPGKPKFGNPLDITLFDNFDAFTSMTIKTAVEQAIAYYEPRITLEDVRVILTPEFNRVIVEIQFGVIVNNNLEIETLYLPFAHNTMTYISTRDIRTINQID